VLCSVGVLIADLRGWRLGRVGEDEFYRYMSGWREGGSGLGRQWKCWWYKE
jgi:hypothetical protein